MDGLIVLLVIVGVAAVFVIGLYNRLVALRQTRKNAFSDIDVQLKQRYDLVPTLVETVKGYAQHEAQVFQTVTEARARIGKAGAGPGAERIMAENALSGALMNLFAVAENYPALKADQNFQRLMAELSDLENKLAAARRFFNSATNEFNTSVQQFPSNIIANTFGFKEEPFFEVEEKRETLQKAPEVNFTGKAKAS